jgi:hypothetical protein
MAAARGAESAADGGGKAGARKATSLPAFTVVWYR